MLGTADVDAAARVDVPVGKAAGTAAELDALGVEAVGRQVPREAVAQLADARQAADVDLVAAAIADDRADRAEVVRDVLGVEGEVDRVEVVVQRQVLLL